MERCKKSDVLGLLTTMIKANDFVIKAIPAAPEELTDVFVQCQEAALQIGSYVETFGEQYRSIVTLLEEYCENVYQMSIVTWNENMCRKWSKKIRKQLTELTNLLQQELPEDRKEVVFLPYKASMWDSLESVWKAADEDANTDAYVIPIPYFDKNPDGSFREEHYEGDLYPEYVPITRYDEYDFENRRPDIIFIHNAYDDSNYVTSVHPFFYSGNLKRFTDKLIYIPYFVLGEIDPENEEAVERIKHFCITKGVLNADRVIVQSENMKKIYVNVLTEFMNKHTGEDTRKYWEEKILGLGSPKMDKVASTKKEDVEVPQEWLKVIEKPDGSWKKIILYNTSVQALLEHNEKMNAKIRDVLQVFKENQEEIALLWRPHPLIEATIRSVRPGLWEEYEKIVNRYKDEGWGIYDDTAELERAIAISDGYYGDGSSVVQLCQKKKIPVMLQNVEILSATKVSLNCADFVRYDDRVFILTRDTQCLFEYFPETGKTGFCGIVKGRPKQFYISMVLYKNKLYIVPFVGEDICIYNIDTKKMELIPLGKSDGGLVRKHYQLCFNYQDNIYLLSVSEAAMLCLDTNNNKISDISKWMQEFKKKFKHSTYVETLANICIIENCFWVAIHGNNVLLEYNMLTNEYHFWNVGKRKIQYVTVSFDGKYFWLSGDEKFIVRWEKEQNEVKEFDNFPNGFESGDEKIVWKGLFSNGYLWKDFLYFSPLNSNMLIRFNKNTEKMECMIQTDMNHFCFRIKEISDSEIYMEEDNIKDGFIGKSYFIKMNGEYRSDSIKSEEWKEYYNSLIEFDIVSEEYPQGIVAFLDTIKKKNNTMKK